MDSHGILVKMACMVMILCMVLSLNAAKAKAISCKEVGSKLLPCLGYVTNGGSVRKQGSCCAGVIYVNSQARTRPQRQAVCRCLTCNIAKGTTAEYISRATGLPAKCGINNFPSYNIHSSADCKSVR